LHRGLSAIAELLVRYRYDGVIYVIGDIIKQQVSVKSDCWDVVVRGVHSFSERHRS